MKIECLKDKFASAISKAEKITGRNLSLPVLGCVYLQADKSNLIIKATNLDLGVEIKIPVKTEQVGIAAVPGHILNSFISNLRDDKSIKLSLEDKNLKIFTAQNSTVIKCLNHEDFPTIPAVSKEKSFGISSEDFLSGLKSVWYSSSVSSMKPELSSVYIYQDDGNIIFAATDSFRLAEKRIKMKKAKEFGSIMIPYKNIPEIIRVLEDVKDEIEICLDKNQISFKHGDVYLTSRVIDGVFPDYKQIIPQGHTTQVAVLKQDLMNSLKLANIFSDKFNLVNVKAKPGAKIFEISTRNTDVGENLNKIDAALSGEDVDINFNYKYIADCFQSVNSDSVELDFNGLSKPLVIRGVGDSSFMYLVMPMNK